MSARVWWFAPGMRFDSLTPAKGNIMYNIVWIIGAIVIIIAVLSFFGLR